MKAAVFRIWVDAHNNPLEPAFIPPCFCLEKDLHAVTHANGFAHYLCTRFVKKNSPNANVIMTPPFSAHCGSPVM